MLPHPLQNLSVEETRIARDVVLSLHPGVVVDFREIYLQEPAKDAMKAFLALEHSARLSPTSPRPSRLAKCQYDVVDSDRIPAYHESVVDVISRKRVKHEVVAKEFQASLTLWEFDILLDACKRSHLFQEELAKLKLPDGFELVIEPWPYGGKGIFLLQIAANLTRT